MQLSCAPHRLIPCYAFLAAVFALPAAALAQTDLQLSSTFSAERQTAGLPGVIFDSNVVTPMPDPVCCNFGGTTVTAGRRIQWDSTASNGGPNTAANVSIRSVLPPGCTVIENTLTTSPNVGQIPGRCVVSPVDAFRQEVTCDYPSLTNGQAAAVRFMVLVDSSFPRGTQLTMDAFATTTTTDTNQSNNITSIQFDVQPFSDFQITNVADPVPVVAGEQAHHRITLQNKGPSTAHGLSMLNALTEGGPFLRLAQANILGAAGHCYQDLFQTPGVNCDLGDVLPGRIITVDLDMDVDPATPDMQNLASSVSLAGFPTLQVRAGQDLDEALSTTTKANLMVDHDTLDAIVDAGEEAIYHIGVTNQGASDAQALVVTQTLPAGLSYLADNAGGMEGPTGTLTFNLGTLPAGKSRGILVLTALAADAADGSVLTSVATATSATADPAPDNNTASALVVVNVPPSPVINVQPPSVTVQPPVVNVEAPVVNVPAAEPAPSGGACGAAALPFMAVSMLGLIAMGYRRRR